MLVDGGLVGGGHSADQTLALALRQRHHQSGCVDWCFAGREHNLGYAAPHEAAEVEPRAAGKLIELQASQLGKRFGLRQLTLDEPAQNVSQSPASTSRIRCQCVPAQ
jgi:hypothetical protein